FHGRMKTRALTVVVVAFYAVIAVAAAPVVDYQRVVPVAVHATKAEVQAAYAGMQLEVVPAQKEAVPANIAKEMSPQMRAIVERDFASHPKVGAFQESLRDRAHGLWFF